MNTPSETVFESPRFQPWHELTILAVIGMETSWVALWFRVLSRSGAAISFLRAWAVLAGMLVGVTLLAYLLNLLRLRVKLRRAALAGLLVGGVLTGLKLLLFLDQPVGVVEILRRLIYSFSRPDGTIPAEFILSLGLIWIWWRGVYLAGRDVDTALVKNSFYLGAAMLFGYGLIAPATGEMLRAPLYLFLFSWLSAMSTARIDRLARFGRGQAASFDRRWLAGVIMAVIGVVGMAALAAALVDWKIAGLVKTVLGWLVWAIVAASVLVLSPLIFLLSLLMPLLEKWMQDLPQSLESMREAIDQLGRAIAELEKATPEKAFSLPAFVQPAILWGILGLAVLYVVWTLHQRYLKSTPGPKEEAEMILTEGEYLRKALANLRGAAQSLAGQLGDLLSLANARRRLAAARIRRIYSQLLDLAADLGKPRPHACTPLEYLPTLENLFPNQSGELKLITAAYLRVRYGEMPESSQEADQAEQAWKRLREQGRMLQEYQRMKKPGG